MQLAGSFQEVTGVELAKLTASSDIIHINNDNFIFYFIRTT